MGVSWGASPPALLCCAPPGLSAAEGEGAGSMWSRTDPCTPWGWRGPCGLGDLLSSLPASVILQGQTQARSPLGSYLWVCSSFLQQQLPEVPPLQGADLSDAVLHNLTVCRALGAAASASARAGEDAEEHWAQQGRGCLPLRQHKEPARARSLLIASQRGPSRQLAINMEQREARLHPGCLH